MLKEIKAVIERSQATILEDVLGGISLLVVLVGGLHLPGVFA